MSNDVVNLEFAGKLSAAERLDMTLKGYSPFSKNDILNYRKGNVLSLNEKQKRINTRLGNSENLGGGYEKEFDLNSLSEKAEKGEDVAFEELEVETPKKLQSKLFEDFDNLETRNTGKVFKTDDFVSLKKKEPAATQTPNSKNIEAKGFEDAKDYLNAFIKNLQEPSIKNRMDFINKSQVFARNLKILVENKNNLALYNNGAIKAEKAMYEKLTK